MFLASLQTGSANLITPLNQRSVTEGNAEGFLNVVTQPAFENIEPPQNDRNQFLQTGHLSDEGPSIAPTAVSSVLGDNSYNQLDHLPPPGLSRLVLGEPETTSASQSIQPPPGLDRMVPGTELSNAVNLNLERQADGQDVVQAPVQNRLTTTATPTQYHQLEGGRNMNDRNLYFVAGENNTDSPIQRVVTGDDNLHNIDNPVTEPRELVMDGENLEDDNQQQAPPVAKREEPIEGANTSDELANQHAVSLPQQTDLSENFHPKFNPNSNPSTGNEESDREKYYQKKNTEGRKSEERSNRRGAKRYDTEDTDHSMRDSRVYRDGRNSKNDKSERYDRERESAKSRDKYSQRSHRERPKEKYSRDGYEETRYERKPADKYRDSDKYSRYETDGSRYDTEDPKYEKSSRRKNDRDQGRHRDNRPDRHYRRERDLDERERGNFDIFNNHQLET